MSKIGEMLSHYRLLEKIGEGGMGIVWKAEDTVLRRTVAVKLLSNELAFDEERRRRFVEEARLAASVSHGNIVQVHELGREGDRAFIVMEYVEGTPLNKILHGRPLPANKVAELGLQIAQGLSQAHRKKLIHRDLKPANILVTSEGDVKLVDFGLAMLFAPSDLADSSLATTLTYGKFTERPAVAGTLPYMSPEQLRGEELDARSDIFSFGTVLYEMTTGRRPFGGAQAPDVAREILKSQPTPVRELVPETPFMLGHVIEKALGRSPEDRYQHAEDIAVDLRRLAKDLETGSSPSYQDLFQQHRRPRSRRGLIWGLSVVSIALIVALIALLAKRQEGTPRPSPTHRQVSFTGEAYEPEVSPDGVLVAYITGEDAVVHDVEGGQVLKLFDEVQYCSALRWRPDGKELVFAVRTGLIGWKGKGATSRISNATAFVVSRLGGDRKELPQWYSLLCWSPNASRLAATWQRVATRRAPLSVVVFDVEGNGRSEFALDWLRGGGVEDIDWSPVTDLLLCEVQNGSDEVWVLAPDGAHPTRVLEEPSGSLRAARWSPTEAAIYYLRGGSSESDLLKLRVDSGTGEPMGEPIPILTGLQAGPSFSISSDGSRLAYTRELVISNLWLARLPAGRSDETDRARQLTSGTFVDVEPRLSPQGDRVAFSRGQAGISNIHVLSLDDGTIEQLTFLTGRNESPVWSPDGETIAFGSTHEDPAVWLVSAGGGAPRRLQSTEISSNMYLEWAPGDRILCLRPGDQNLHFVDPVTEEEEPLLDPHRVEGSYRGFTCYQPRVSPDGSRVAIRNSIDPGILVVNIGDSQSTTKVLTRGYRFGFCDQTIDAGPYLGRPIALKAMVRAEVSGEGNHGHLWLRIDRGPLEYAFHDAMQDRPITSPEWREYEIRATVDPEATHIAFGGRLSGTGTVWLDDFRLQVHQEDGWQEIPIQNPGFETAAGQSPTSWNLYQASFTLSRDHFSEGSQALSIQWESDDASVKVPIGWSADGEFLYVREQDNSRVLRIPVSGGPAVTVLDSLPPGEYAAAVTPDGSSIVTVASRTQSDVWVVENFDHRGP